ncbi:hypothetical protein E4J90_06830 [Pseudomonas kribbensis]|uniref:Uncharacterized protein n=1 Tax=Pseudomonas kribbensis TaxID=1628086 RepID=A0A4Y8VPJ7_9PSED|nr:hypothetical protein E4J90_06830 [Pseudomonas kribbensis]
MIIAPAGPIAGKPAPTGLASDLDFVLERNTVGAGLPAMRPDYSPQTPDHHYRSRIASVRAFSTGLSK